MTGEQIGVVSVLFGLLCFGLLYDQAVTRAKPAGYLEPYTALWVAVGTLVTIGGVAIIDTLVDWNAGLITLLCFVASGSPMILGDMARYVKRVQRDLESMRDD